MEITFDYEYDCGGHVYERTVEMEKDEFEQDMLLTLVCSYMQTWGGYPGKDIDMYLHNRFPDIHTLEDMYGHSIYNVYRCNVEGLKDFSRIADILLGMTYKEGEDEVNRLCREYNQQFKGKSRENQSIWE